MEFEIDYFERNENKVLVYNLEEFSFDTKPSIHEVNFDIVLNKLNLSAIGDDNRIVQVWGFCGYKEWIISDFHVPKSKKGVLKVVSDLEFGLAYSVSKMELPIYVNMDSGWICVGNPIKVGNTVEFINNCVAVIGSHKEFVSLWLKPSRLPL